MIHPIWKRLQLCSAQALTSSEFLSSVALSIVAGCLLMLCWHPSLQVRGMLLILRRLARQKGRICRVPDDLCTEVSQALCAQCHVSLTPAESCRSHADSFCAKTGFSGCHSACHVWHAGACFCALLIHSISLWCSWPRQLCSSQCSPGRVCVKPQCFRPCHLGNPMGCLGCWYGVCQLCN